MVLPNVTKGNIFNMFHKGTFLARSLPKNLSFYRTEICKGTNVPNWH